MRIQRLDMVNPSSFENPKGFGAIHHLCKTAPSAPAPQDHLGPLAPDACGVVPEDRLRDDSVFAFEVDVASLAAGRDGLPQGYVLHVAVGVVDLHVAEGDLAVFDLELDFPEGTLSSGHDDLVAVYGVVDGALAEFHPFLMRRREGQAEKASYENEAVPFSIQHVDILLVGCVLRRVIRFDVRIYGIMRRRALLVMPGLRRKCFKSVTLGLAHSSIGKAMSSQFMIALIVEGSRTSSMIASKRKCANDLSSFSEGTSFLPSPCMTRA